MNFFKIIQLRVASVFWAGYSYISERVVQLFAPPTNPAACGLGLGLGLEVVLVVIVWNCIKAPSSDWAVDLFS